MAISIQLNSAVGKDLSFAGYLADYQSSFAASSGQWGGFNSWNPFATSGSQYAQGEGSVFNSGNTDLQGFIAGGDLQYTLFSAPSHTFYGTLNTLEFGHGLQGVSPRSFVQSDIVISNLGLSSAKSEGRAGDVHEVVYGLMKPQDSASGGISHLLDYLNSNQLNLVAGAGNDTLQGYSQNDVLTGGAGADTFYFGLYGSATSFGNDTVSDYAAGEKIQVSNAIYADYSAFSGAGGSVSESAGNTIIDTNGHGTITLTGVTSFDLADLQFV